MGWHCAEASQCSGARLLFIVFLFELEVVRTPGIFDVYFSCPGGWHFCSGQLGNHNDTQSLKCCAVLASKTLVISLWNMKIIDWYVLVLTVGLPVDLEELIICFIC